RPIGQQRQDEGDGNRDRQDLERVASGDPQGVQEIGVAEKGRVVVQADERRGSALQRTVLREAQDQAIDHWSQLEDEDVERGRSDQDDPGARNGPVQRTPGPRTSGGARSPGIWKPGPRWELRGHGTGVNSGVGHDGQLSSARVCSTSAAAGSRASWAVSWPRSACSMWCARVSRTWVHAGMLGFELK